ncbi:farnesyl pyrophosphate synthase-like [Xylocopa sonorina]|uniref:farnesyl pyrophosphate synthase-like n=1 Tax=Xylocopa sonorina TaxID=1818115 RepID=UPI00403AC28F
MSQKKYLSNEDELRELMAVWPDIVRDITEQLSDLPEVNKWIAKALQYNVPGGSARRGLSVVYTFKTLYPSDELPEEELYKARVLAWCIELLQAFLLTIDDIQDKSKMRRNKPAWYIHHDINLRAITDAVLMNTSIYVLFKKYFKSKDYYMDLVELFLDITHKTNCGQCLDLIPLRQEGKLNLDLFTMNRYNALVKYKTSYYTLVLPVIGAMYMVGIKDPEVHRQAKTILLEIGHFFQIRNDYLDFYTDPEHPEVYGTQDIEEGKCTWLIVVALQRATPKQRKILEECYGSSDKEKINRVKQVYIELGIANTYAIYEEETHSLLHTHIQQVSRGLTPEFFLRLLQITCPKVGRKS